MQEICASYLDLLERNGIRPLYDFDGLPLPEKETEREESEVLEFDVLLIRTSICRSCK